MEYIGTANILSDAIEKNLNNAPAHLTIELNKIWQTVVKELWSITVLKTTIKVKLIKVILQ